MQKQFKQLVLLAALVPTFAMAQALSNSAPAAPAAAAPIDADKKAAGDQAFRIVDHFDKHSAELVLSYDAASGETRASMDTNGDGKADMIIRLTGDEHAYTHFVL